VLIVEIDELAARSLLHALVRHFDATWVDWVGEALHVLATERVDVVVTADELGGGIRGEHLLAEVAKRWPHVRRVLLAEDADSAAAATTFADAVLRKPALYDQVMRACGVQTAYRSPRASACQGGK
jgi:ActR/RegA family two-component response regulator